VSVLNRVPQQEFSILSKLRRGPGIFRGAHLSASGAYYISTTLFVNHKKCLKSLAYFWYNAFC
jgi:hypothetical protein